jgi:ABC-type transporter lipoprotein component MlaA
MLEIVLFTGRVTLLPNSSISIVFSNLSQVQTLLSQHLQFDILARIINYSPFIINSVT